MTHRYGLSRSQLERLSLELEEITGFDSIRTVEALYDRNCCFPDCEYRRIDPIALWEHVHFSKHGKSFGVTLQELIAKADVTGVRVRVCYDELPMDTQRLGDRVVDSTPDLKEYRNAR